MTSERWQRIENLFHAALEREAQERVVFLSQACVGDAELRYEIEALLASFDEAGDFIEQPLVGNSLTSLPEQTSAPESMIGHKIGNYEILSLLGTGGMGEVYLARDARLDRQIALKLLPAQFTQDPDQVRRFEREARAASALNHPNIITIYEIGQEGETHFIAMEFIAGRTLREVITAQKPSIGEALNIASQIANALQAAHAAGIVHRDIKPENLMVRPDGLVKVLDFGLAKPAAPNIVETTTGRWRRPETVSLQTDPKMLMGTLAYLSPEQGRGEPVDYRTDIFSLGVVLYEMVSGTRPFDGQNATAILDAIQRQPVAPVEIAGPVRSALQTPLNAVISKALAKDRAARYAGAAEMQADLRALVHALEAPTTNLLEQKTLSALWWHGWKGKATLAAGALAVLAGMWSLWPPAGSGPNAPTLGVKEARRLTDQAGYKLFPSLSPDGQSVIYASRTGTNWDIYLQKVGAREAINLTADSPHVDLHPTFAPDGERIAFYSSRGGGGGIFLMNADGTHVTQLTAEGYNPAWSPDGREIVYGTDRIFDHEGRIKPSQLWAVNVTTKTRRLVTDRDAVQPSWSPSGARIAFWGTHKGGRRDIWTVAAKGGEPVAVTNDEYIDWNPVWARDGRHLYFLSNRGGGMNLWRVPINEATGKVGGAPEPMTLPSASSQHLSFSGDGRSLVYVQMNRREDLWQVAFDPVAGKITGAPARLTQNARRHSYPELSPDDGLILFTTLGETQEDLFVLNPDGTGGRQLTDDTFRNRNSHWSPDGRQIAFASDRSGKYEIWLMNRDGSSLRQLTAVPDEDAAVPVWSPDGLRLVYLVANRAYAIEPSKPFAAQTPQPLPGAPPQNFSLWSWSPDRNFLAGWEVRPERQDGGVVLYSFAAQAYERLTDRGRQPIWLNDSRRLLFIDLGKVYLLDRATGAWSAIHAVLPDNIGGCTLSRDNRTLYYSQARNETDLWLLALR